jgi:hypothetical protein
MPTIRGGAALQDANCANLRERTVLPAFAIIRGIRVALLGGLILTRAGRAIG